MHLKEDVYCASGGWQACAEDYVSKVDAHAAVRMPVVFLNLDDTAVKVI